jgi:Na+/proline symporter
MLFGVTWYTSRNATNESYFVGNRSSRWYVVAYGMIGASLSGVTFISVPGAVGGGKFGYLQVVLGYIAGYAVIAYVLLPLYYKLNLTSIYTYLEQRFGKWSYKTGSFYFIISRTIGASFRLYIVVNVLQQFVFDKMGVPFYLTAFIFILLILLFTFEGGVKTIVWTDTLQTSFMLLSLVLCIFLIVSEMGTGIGGTFNNVINSDYSKTFFTDWHEKSFFLKTFFGGMFITIAMTGLDQEMMQKNISCKTLGEAQKNMMTFTAILFFVNLLFLFLGALLYQYAASANMQLPAKSDDLFPTIALNNLGMIAGLFFIIGLISAAYPSADGALTALTASFMIDLIGIRKRPDMDEEKIKRIRYIVHISFAMLLLMVIVVFRLINDDAVINNLFTAAGYTYGPLLGLFAFGILTKRILNDNLSIIVCVITPVLCFTLNKYSDALLGGYKFGFEMLILNGLLTFCGLWLISKKGKDNL